MSGVAGGSTFGIAKCATLHSVRVYATGDPDDDDVVAGIDWVAGHHESPAVMNLSLGGVPGSFAYRNAIEGAIASGVITIKAAGNEYVDAYQDRANRAKGLIIVGATTNADDKSSYSNSGSLITVFAPGSGLRSATSSSDTATALVSGTSFSGPLAVGVAALFLEQEPTASQARVSDLFRRSATANVLSNIGSSSPNLLLYSRVMTSSYSAPASYPVAPDIYGPITVRPNSNCLYSLSNVTVDPQSYEWYSGGTLQNETSEFFRAPAGSTGFQIEVRVTDTNGRSWWNYKYVTVSSEAPECNDS